MKKEASPFLIGVMTAVALFAWVFVPCEACVTVNTQNDTYTVDSSGCVE